MTKFCSQSLDKELARREDQIKKRIDKLIDDYYNQEDAGKEKYMSYEEFKQAKKRMNQRLEEVEKEKKKVVDKERLQERMSLIINSIKDFYSSIKSNIDYLDWQTKRDIVRTLIKQVSIGFDQVEVTFRIRKLAQEEGIFNLCYCNERVGVFMP